MQFRYLFIFSRQRSKEKTLHLLVVKVEFKFFNSKTHGFLSRKIYIL